MLDWDWLISDGMIQIILQKRLEIHLAFKEVNTLGLWGVSG